MLPWIRCKIIGGAGGCEMVKCKFKGFAGKEGGGGVQKYAKTIGQQQQSPEASDGGSVEKKLVKILAKF